MFCPKCGQEKTGPETNFCSKCGFLLTGTAALLQSGGNLPDAAAGTPGRPASRRKRGVKQGLFIFLLGFLIVPLVALICVSFQIGPEPVAVAALLLGVGGLLRMAYAWLLEDDQHDPSIHQQPLGGSVHTALPPQQSIPASAYTTPGPGNWRDTNDLQPSVTENTTRHLGGSEPPQ